MQPNKIEFQQVVYSSNIAKQLMSHLMFGIAYGSKLSGNTVISIMKNNKIYFLDVDENVDCDEFILNAARHFKPEIVYINAPLSVPAVYKCVNGFKDHQFRKADKELCSISPMIIGGVTARAIELKEKLEAELETKVYETCSKSQAKNYCLDQHGYKKNGLHLVSCRNHIGAQLSKKVMFDCTDVKTWNHLDAFLSLITAMRFVMGMANSHGDPDEGLIYV